MTRLLEAYGWVVDSVEPDAPLAITGAAHAAWAGADSLPVTVAAQHAEDRDLRLGAIESARQQLRAQWTAAAQGTTQGTPPMHGRGLGEQTNPTWGLDRIDQRSRPLDRKYHYDALGELQEHT